MNPKILLGFFFALCWYAVPLSFAEGVDNTPTAEFAIAVRNVAPLVIQDCVVKSVSSSDLALLKKRAKQRNGSEQLTHRQLAILAIEYYAPGCFNAANIDEEVNLDTPWSNPQSFARALKGKRFSDFKSVSEIQTLLTLFNTHQNCIFGLLSSCTSDSLNHNYLPNKEIEQADPLIRDIPKGHTSLALEDVGAYIQLTAKTAIKSHTNGVDDGADAYKTFYIKKLDFSIAAELVGVSLPIAGSPLILQFKEAYANCAGTGLGGTFAIHDTYTNRMLYEHVLPDGARSASAVRKTSASSRNSFSMIIEGENEASDEKMAATCDLPYWSRFYKYKYSVYCKPGAHQCVTKKVLLHQYHACSSIGACD